MKHARKAKPAQRVGSADDFWTAGERAILAWRVLFNSNIVLTTAHVSGVKDDANARAEIIETMFFKRAARSDYQNGPGGEVSLSVQALKAMLALADDYKYRVTEIAGGSHSKGSRHYAGVALDVDQINGVPVSAKNPYVREFKKRCHALGATKVLGPGDKEHNSHVHAAWPRPT